MSIRITVDVFSEQAESECQDWTSVSPPRSWTG